jgi:hypothetical protein
MAKKKDPLDHMLDDKPEKQPSALQYEMLDELIDQEATELTGKDRETVMRRIEALEKGKGDINVVRTLRFQIKTRLLNEIAKRSRAAEQDDEDDEEHGQ